MNDVIIGIFVGSAVALVAAIIGWLLNRNSAKDAVDLSFGKMKDLLRHQEFIIAYKKFRNAFIVEYSTLDNMTNMISGKKPYIYIMLRDSRPKHRAAVMEFMIFLPGKQKSALREAWIHYSGEDYEKKEKDRPFYYVKESDKIISELAQEVISRMDMLFDVAKP